jgi:hypothetical protein
LYLYLNKRLKLFLNGIANREGPRTLERDRLELIAESNEPIVAIEVREGAEVQVGTVVLRQELGAMQAGKSTAIRMLCGLLRPARSSTRSARFRKSLD